MSKIDELIEKLCPDGVEYKKLSAITNLRAGDRITKSMMNDSLQYPVYGGGTVYTGKYNDYNFEHSITISRAGSAGFVNWVEEKFWATDVCFVASQKCENVNIKYVYYYVKNKQTELQTKIYGGNLPKLNKDYLWQLPVPVPPLEVQREIVHILDDFTLLSAELKARQKQYKEYLEILLNINNIKNYKKMKMNELFDFRNGLSKGKEYFGKGTPFIRYTDVYNKRFLRKSDITQLVTCTDKELANLKIKRGDVFFTRTSEIAEEVGYSSVMLDEIENCVFNGFTIKASPKTNYLLPEYCVYCFSTNEFRNYVATQCAFTTRASLTGKTIGEFEIAVPSIDEQKRIY